jgi:hypothetical protein
VVLDGLAALGEKKAGSPAGALARERIRQYLEERVPEAVIRRESFPVEVCRDSSARIGWHGHEGQAHLHENTGHSGGEVEGPLLFAGTRLRRRDRRKARGCVVAFGPSALVHRVVQVASALRCGAAAVVLVSSHDEFLPRGVGYPTGLGPCPIPAVGIMGAQWRAIRRSGADRLRLRYDPGRRAVTAENLIADLPSPAGTGPLLVLGAHYDSWYAGCQDNCIAVQLLVDLLADLHAGQPLGHSVRGIFFDAEEIGALGSVHHVGANDTQAYAFYLNLEMPVPARTGRLRTFCYSGEPFVRRCLSPLRIALGGSVPVPLKLFYKVLPVFPADVDSFFRAGVPCATTYCSNPFYHTPRDNPGNIRLELYPEIRASLSTLMRRLDREAPALGAPRRPPALKTPGWLRQ